jgi:hypothetical protein
VGDIERYYDRDPYFGEELWLRKECCGGHVLWAFNLEHLNFLEAFIAAKLRERPANNPAEMRDTMTWKLPGWMKAAKNRDELIEKIHRIRDSVPT